MYKSNCVYIKILIVEKKQQKSQSYSPDKSVKFNCRFQCDSGLIVMSTR